MMDITTQKRQQVLTDEALRETSVHVPGSLSIQKTFNNKCLFVIYWGTFSLCGLNCLVLNYVAQACLEFMDGFYQHSFPVSRVSIVFQSNASEINSWLWSYSANRGLMECLNFLILKVGKTLKNQQDDKVSKNVELASPPHDDLPRHGVRTIWSTWTSKLIY